MKTFLKGCLVAAVFFIGTLALLEVDRRCALLYGTEATISNMVQVFIENNLDFH
ncbi:MAG: hypothetical protein IJP00_04240 [Firmicutes bacterium]|nr:hypothetical protein [Bacillota bacterium]